MMMYLVRMTTFTAVVKTQHAKDLRRKRDLTDADLRAEYHAKVTDEQLAKRRARDTFMRNVHLQRAMTDAVDRVLGEARDEGLTPFVSDDDEDEKTWISTSDFEGATITLSVADLVVTATLTIPEVVQSAAGSGSESDASA